MNALVFAAVLLATIPACDPSPHGGPALRAEGHWFVDVPNTISFESNPTNFCPTNDWSCEPHYASYRVDSVTCDHDCTASPIEDGAPIEVTIAALGRVEIVAHITFTETGATQDVADVVDVHDIIGIGADCYTVWTPDLGTALDVDQALLAPCAATRRTTDSVVLLPTLYETGGAVVHAWADPGQDSLYDVPEFRASAITASIPATSSTGMFLAYTGVDDLSSLTWRYMFNGHAVSSPIAVPPLCSGIYCPTTTLEPATQGPRH